ncbi:MAG: CBS domain-containing protein, partial [Thioalkalispiraceae bacterium]
ALMDEKGIGALVVTHNDRLVGILSERDYARKVVLKGRSSRDTSVDEIMTRDVLYTVPEQDIEDCMVMMSEHHIRHMPVMQNGILVGMVTLGDVVNEIIKEQQIKIKHLEQTISWGESY